MLDDKDIFNAVFSRNPNEPIEVIMHEYEKARSMNAEIEKRLSGCSCDIVNAEQISAEASEPQKERKRYTRRMLKVKPEEAIGEDIIRCCICGKEGQIITAKHLEKHGISVEDYKRLCRYPSDQMLMSKNRERFTRELVVRAQEARKAKSDGEKTE